MAFAHSLQVADVAFQKVHDARRKNEAGEYSKETSDACGRENQVNFIQFSYFFSLFFSSMKPDRVSFHSVGGQQKRNGSVVAEADLFCVHRPVSFFSFDSKPNHERVRSRKKKFPILLSQNEFQFQHKRAFWFLIHTSSSRGSKETRFAFLTLTMTYDVKFRRETNVKSDTFGI